MTERKPNLHLKPESEVDGKKKLTRKKNLGQKIKDLSIFCNKTQLRQNKEVTSLSMSRFQIVTTLSEVFGTFNAN